MRSVSLALACAVTSIVFAVAVAAQFDDRGTDTAESVEPVRKAVLAEIDLQVDHVQRIGGLDADAAKLLRLCSQRVLDRQLAGSRRFHTQQVAGFVSRVLADSFWTKMRDSLVGGEAAERIELAKTARGERLQEARIDVLLATLDVWLRLSQKQLDSIRPLLERSMERAARHSVSWYRGADDAELAPLNTIIWTLGDQMTSFKEGLQAVLTESQYQELDEALDPNGFNMNVALFDEEAD